MEIKNKNILVLSPHTDDETLGCGGFINKLSKHNNINFVCFSYCDNNSLKEEYFNAVTSLCGDNITSLKMLEFKVRYFDRQEVLDELLKIKKQINPDIVICPSKYDIHQDHLVVYNESVRAFKDKTILGYCHNWNIIGISDLRLFIKLDETNIISKHNAMDKYLTQSERKYFKDRLWVGNEEKLEIITWKIGY